MVEISRLLMITKNEHDGDLLLYYHYLDNNDKMIMTI